jgi:hypothetical protein
MDPTRLKIIDRIFRRMLMSRFPHCRRTTAGTLEILGEVVAIALNRGPDSKSFTDIMRSTTFSGRENRIYSRKIVRQS